MSRVASAVISGDAVARSVRRRARGLLLAVGAWCLIAAVALAVSGLQTVVDAHHIEAGSAGAVPGPADLLAAVALILSGAFSTVLGGTVLAARAHLRTPRPPDRADPAAPEGVAGCLRRGILTIAVSIAAATIATPALASTAPSAPVTVDSPQSRALSTPAAFGDHPGGDQPEQDPDLQVPTPAWSTGAGSEPSRPAPDPSLATSTPIPSSTDGHPASQSSVVVHRGDTLWAIAQRHLGPSADAAAIDAEWRRWYRANSAVIGPDPHLILPGQVLHTPSDSPGPVVPSEESS